MCRGKGGKGLRGSKTRSRSTSRTRKQTPRLKRQQSVGHFKIPKNELAGYLAIPFVAFIVSSVYENKWIYMLAWLIALGKLYSNNGGSEQLTSQWKAFSESNTGVAVGIGSLFLLGCCVIYGIYVYWYYLTIIGVLMTVGFAIGSVGQNEEIDDLKKRVRTLKNKIKSLRTRELSIDDGFDQEDVIRAHDERREQIIHANENLLRAKESLSTIEESEENVRDKIATAQEIERMKLVKKIFGYAKDMKKKKFGGENITNDFADFLATAHGSPFPRSWFTSCFEKFMREYPVLKEGKNCMHFEKYELIGGQSPSKEDLAAQMMANQLGCLLHGLPLKDTCTADMHPIIYTLTKAHKADDETLRKAKEHQLFTSVNRLYKLGSPKSGKKKKKARSKTPARGKRSARKRLATKAATKSAE